MSSRLNYTVTFIVGVVAGVILTVGLAYAASFYNAQNGSRSNPNVRMFEHPAQAIPIRAFRVMQVLDDGSALATATTYGTGEAEDIRYFGTVVLFPSKEGTSYYDNQCISVPKGKILKQIGTFRYGSRQEDVKTVPILDFFDK